MVHRPASGPNSFQKKKKKTKLKKTLLKVIIFKLDNVINQIILQTYEC